MLRLKPEERSYSYQKVYHLIERNQKHVTAIKLAIGKCFDCPKQVNNDTISIMEFDHLPAYTKRYAISFMVGTGHSIKAIDEEISKCQMVCHDCHCVRTAKRRFDAKQSEGCIKIV